MKIIVPDHVVSHAVSKGMKPSEAASVILAIEDPIAVIDLNGRTRYDGHGVTVIGATDRTGKFFKVMSIRVDRDRKA